MKRVIGQRTFDFSRQVAIMAIINRTRDSFYDRGKDFHFGAALASIERALAAGADWIDIGAVPFSPLAEAVTEQEEIDRVVPLIAAARDRTDAVISVDTFRAGVARRALAEGADVINDTSGFHDPGTAAAVAEAQAAIVVTHSKAAPRQWLARPTYIDVVSEIREYLAERVHYAEENGIAPDRIIVDPGHDLNKNTYHSLELTRRLHELSDLGYPLLASVSNKDFIAETLGLQGGELTAGTVATLTVCVLQGARILRVHDVAAAVAAAQMTEAIMGWRQPVAPRHNLDGPF